MHKRINFWKVCFDRTSWCGSFHDTDPGHVGWGQLGLTHRIRIREDKIVCTDHVKSTDGFSCVPLSEQCTLQNMEYFWLACESFEYSQKCVLKIHSLPNFLPTLRELSYNNNHILPDPPPAARCMTLYKSAHKHSKFLFTKTYGHFGIRFQGEWETRNLI